MPKDYKQRPARKKVPARTSRKAVSAPSRWPAFLVGVAMGVAATILVLRYEPGESLEKAVKAALPADSPPGERSTRFEFYTVLPEKEIAIPDTDLEPAPRPAARAPDPVAAAPATAPASAPAAQPGTERYMVQVASFRSPGDADRLKAELALLGLESRIQTVTLDGRETWHRVHVGPYRSLDEVSGVRSRLADNKLKSIVLKLK